MTHTTTVLGQLEDGNTQAQLGAQQVSQHATAQEKAAEEDDDDDDIPALEEPAEEEAVDETGVDAKDVELIMSQVRWQQFAYLYTPP